MDSSYPISTPELRLAQDPQGHARWLWQAHASGPVVDLSAAGLPADLPAVAIWLTSGPEAQAALINAAQPIAGAKNWPLLRPGKPGKALALGRNFAAHAAEMGAAVEQEMLWFCKLPDILVGPHDDFVKPPWLEGRIDPEAEVVLLIGADLQNATADQAQQAIAAYSLGNDLTARGIQAGDKERKWPWLRSKNVATFGSFGPGWIPATAMPDFAELELHGLVNGELRQQASMADMIWPPAQALQILSQWLPLYAGDIVYLGTPSGVAGVEVGDQLVVEIPGLMRLENTLRI
jgi:2-keto-4-pentenoate hydratase/2-oxohepta-3-ene-1,7-dioic acid hydratase in catechol pathway